MSRKAKLAGCGAPLAAMILVSGCSFSNTSDLPLPGGADLGSDPMTVEVEFNNALDLVPNSGVRVNDVVVGRVSDVELDDWKALVTVQVRGDVDLPENATASIRQTSVLGEKFVSLEAPDNPSATELADGDEIPLSRTSESPEIEQVFSALSLILNGGSIGQLQNIMRELNTALDGNEKPTRSLLNELAEFMGTLSSSRQQIATALDQMDALGAAARTQTPAIVNALDDIPPALQVLEGQRQQFVKMLTSLQKLSDVGTSVIRQSKANTIANLRDLRTILTNLNEAGDSVADALSVLPTAPFPDAIVGDTLQQAQSYRGGDAINFSLYGLVDWGRWWNAMTPAQRSALQGGSGRLDASSAETTLEGGQADSGGRPAQSGVGSLLSPGGEE